MVFLENSSKFSQKWNFYVFTIYWLDIGAEKITQLMDQKIDQNWKKIFFDFGQFFDP